MPADARPAAPAPEVSVVVPTYNRLESLRDSLAGLAAQSLDARRFEVVVVDNGSDDGTSTAVQELAARVPYSLRVFSMPSPNRGPAPARNCGAARARGGIIAFTDSDCRPDARWLEEGLAAFRDPDVAFATGPLLFKPEQLDRLTFFARHSVVCSQEHPTYPTANAFYRKEVFTRYGGMSEALSFRDVVGTAVEAADTDLAWRMKDDGLRNVFVPSAIIYHEVQVTSAWRWLMEPVRLFLVPALVKRHPAMRRTLLSYRVFFYRWSVRYYAAMCGLLWALMYQPVLLWGVPVIALAAGVWRSGSLHPGAVSIQIGRILMNAARVVVMSASLLYGSLRFRTLVL